jgi:hypothetical protein
MPSQRPPRVRKAAPRASQPTPRRAALTASRVSKPVNRAARAAVTQALIGPASVNEVVDVEALAGTLAGTLARSEEEVQTAPPGMESEIPREHAFRYRLQWKAILEGKKDSLRSHSTALTSDNTPEAIAVLANEMRMLSDEEPHWQQLRTSVTAKYTGLAERDWVTSDLGIEHKGLLEMVRQLSDWHKNGQGRLGLSVMVITKCKTYNAFEHLQAPSVSTSQRQRASFTPRRPRDSATTRQLEVVSDEEDEMESEGNYSARITKRWTCGLKGCTNTGKLCYFAGANEHTNHTPIIRPVLITWSEAIRDKRLTSKAPSHEMFAQLMRAKQASVESPRRRVKDGDSAGHPINIYAAGAPAPIPAPPPDQYAPVSSPVRMPTKSPELSTIEKIEAFIVYCKAERC